MAENPYYLNDPLGQYHAESGVQVILRMNFPLFKRAAYMFAVKAQHHEMKKGADAKEYGGMKANAL